MCTPFAKGKKKVALWKHQCTWLDALSRLWKCLESCECDTFVLRGGEGYHLFIHEWDDSSHTWRQEPYNMHFFGRGYRMGRLSVSSLIHAVSATCMVGRVSLVVWWVLSLLHLSVPRQNVGWQCLCHFLGVVCRLYLAIAIVTGCFRFILTCLGGYSSSILHHWTIDILGLRSYTFESS